MNKGLNGFLVATNYYGNRLHSVLDTEFSVIKKAFNSGTIVQINVHDMQQTKKNIVVSVSDNYLTLNNGVKYETKDDYIIIPTWEGLIYEAKNGTAKDVFSIGTVFNLDFILKTTNEKINMDMQIVDFNLDRINGTENLAGVSLISKNVTSLRSEFFENSDSVVQFEDTIAYSYLNGEVYESIPDFIKNNIVRVSKVCRSNSSSASFYTTGAHIWIPSIYELGLTSAGNRGVKYSYFKTNSDRIKKYNNTDTAYPSRDCSTTYYMYGIHSTGVSATNFAGTISSNLVVGFCL